MVWCAELFYRTESVSGFRAVSVVSGATCRSSLQLQLHLIELAINPVRLAEQLPVRTRLGEAALLDHEQPRRPAKRRQAVRDREYRAALNQPLERFLNLPFRLG